MLSETRVNLLYHVTDLRLLHSQLVFPARLCKNLAGNLSSGQAFVFGLGSRGISFGFFLVALCLLCALNLSTQSARQTRITRVLVIGCSFRLRWCELLELIVVVLLAKFLIVRVYKAEDLFLRRLVFALKLAAENFLCSES